MNNIFVAGCLVTNGIVTDCAPIVWRWAYGRSLQDIRRLSVTRYRLCWYPDDDQRGVEQSGSSLGS